MTSKNMMNHFGPPSPGLALKPLMIKEIILFPSSGDAGSVIALDVMVGLRGRRLGDIDRV